ncbi:MAG: hypothetical protein HY650_10695 [Acidobacteria bacterium]|nr:hypothetical protein [Acidobacteriota bacterium]
MTSETEPTPDPNKTERPTAAWPAPPTTAPASGSPGFIRIARGVSAAVLGLLVPGLGHLILGRWIRAIILLSSILAMFAIGAFWMEGRLHLPNLKEPISFFPFMANAGMGVIYLACYLTRTAFAIHAEAPTYEYGNTFLFVTGLANYLVAFDAYDIGTGKKS